MKPAARLGDMHICPEYNGKVPHVGGPIAAPCEPTVLIGYKPAATVGDKCFCLGSTDTVTQGSATVLIDSKAAARVTDKTAHNGVIISGCSSVLIGG